MSRAKKKNSILTPADRERIASATAWKADNWPHDFLLLLDGLKELDPTDYQETARMIDEEIRQAKGSTSPFGVPVFTLREATVENFSQDALEALRRDEKVMLQRIIWVLERASAQFGASRKRAELFAKAVRAAQDRLNALQGKSEPIPDIPVDQISTAPMSAIDIARLLRREGRSGARTTPWRFGCAAIERTMLATMRTRIAAATNRGICTTFEKCCRSFENISNVVLTIE